MQEYQAALLGVAVVGVLVVAMAAKFVREAKEAMAVARRPKQPWDW